MEGEAVPSNLLELYVKGEELYTVDVWTMALLSLTPVI